MIKITKYIILSSLFVLIFSSCSIFKKTEKEEIADESDPRTKTFTFNNFLLEGAKQKTLGNFEAALHNYQLALKIDEKQAAVYYEIAGILSLMGDFYTAVEYAEKSVELDNLNNVYYLSLLANLYKQTNRLSKAAEVYEELIKVNPQGIYFYFELSELYFTLNNSRRAIRTLDRAEKEFGVMDYISLEKERIYRLSGNNSRAIREMEKLSNAFPYDANYKVLLAEAYINNNMNEKARKIYENIDPETVENGLIFFSIADFYRITEDFDKTFEFLQKGFAAHDVDLDIKIKMMINMVELMWYDTYLYQNAAKLMEVLLITYPDDVKVRTLNSDFLIYQGNYEGAQKELDFVLEREKSKFILWEQALFIDHELRDYDAMFHRSKEAVKYFTNQPILYLFFALSAYQTEHYEDVIEAGKNANSIIISDEDMRAQILTFKGEAYRKLDNHPKSDSVFEIVLRINPNDKLVLNNYSYYLALREENLDKALKMSTKLMELDNQSPTYLDTHAWVLYKNGKYEEALEYINKAVQKDETNAIHLEHKGDILYKLSDRENALKYWKKAQEKGGETSDLLEKKIELKTLIE